MTPVSREVLVLPGAGKSVSLGGLGAVFKLFGEDTGGSFALVEHPMAPRSLGAPVHTHRHEDEYSYVLEGEIGAEVGGRALRAGPGALVVKPRGVPHAFWNPTDAPARLLEIISPGGFERYFEEMAAAFAPGAPPDMMRVAEIQARYGVEMDLGSMPRLVAEHGL